MNISDTKSVPIHRWQDGLWTQEDDCVVEEIFLRVYVNGSVYGAMACSPWAIDELVIGGLYTNGVISAYEEVESLRMEGDAVQVKLHSAPTVRRPLERYPPRPLTAQGVADLVRQLEDSSKLFHRTGGVHSAALSDGERILLSCVDVGRHNALDRLIGRCLMQGVSMEDMAIVFTGRVPDEIICKVTKLSCRALISVSAPTSMAIETADKLGVTLICFVRQHRFNVYTHPKRIISGQPQNPSVCWKPPFKNTTE